MTLTNPPKSDRTMQVVAIILYYTIYKHTITFRFKLKQSMEEKKGKVVMVTGASSGIGRDLCLDLAKAGYRILAAARRVDRLNSLCHEINSSSSDTRAVAVELDVSANGPTIQRSVFQAFKAFGSIHALVNNAGVRGR